jgi:hypothetical protein
VASGPVEAALRRCVVERLGASAASGRAEVTVSD